MKNLIQGLLIEHQKKLIVKLSSCVFKEAGPDPNRNQVISAHRVFDAIREMTVPPMTEDEFDEFLDSVVHDSCE